MFYDELDQPKKATLSLKGPMEDYTSHNLGVTLILFGGMHLSTSQLSEHILVTSVFFPVFFFYARRKGIFPAQPQEKDNEFGIPMEEVLPPYGTFSINRN